MTKRSLAVALAATLIAAPSIGQEPDGRVLYMNNCAACHGAELEGQPDWMVRKPDGRLPAPPHDATGHTWHHSDDQLFLIVKDGLAAIAPGYETDMPAFGETMTDAEIEAVLEFIKGTWPEREREIQADRSR
jgi:Cytochrome c, mono- and diheme variants